MGPDIPSLLVSNQTQESPTDVRSHRGRPNVEQQLRADGGERDQPECGLIVQLDTYYYDSATLTRTAGRTIFCVDPRPTTHGPRPTTHRAYEAEVRGAVLVTTVATSPGVDYIAEGGGGGGDETGECASPTAARANLITPGAEPPGRSTTDCQGPT